MLDGVNKWVAGFLGLGIFAAITAVILAAVRTSVTTCAESGAVLNTTQNICVQAANHSAALGSFTTQYNASTNALTATTNLTSQFGTAGTLVGLGILALAAIVILGYFRFGKRD